MKVILLGTEGQSTRLLLNALLKEVDDIKVGLERPISRGKLLRNRLAKFGIVSVLGQLLFMLFVPFLKFESKNKSKSLLIAAGLSSDASSCPASKKFQSVNSEECLEWLKFEAPDVVILNGTRIVSERLLSNLNCIFLNIHCGITPKYRGVHGGYWAFAKNDEANAGVTVHLVDRGIDTGGIIYQQTIARDKEDNFATYPVRQYIAGIPLMKAALADIRNGTLRVQPYPSIESKLWVHPTLFQYLHGRLFRGVK